MKAFFGGLVLARITTKLVEGYRDYRRQQPSIRYKGQPLKGATVNRPIYNMRHAFCTRLSWVAPDAVIERAMRHTSPETKRHYQLGMVEQVREAMEKANQQVYGGSGLVN
jgi:hypothetical protein